MKPVILVFARYYLPGFRAGGPIRTIANMVERLSEDFEFRIVTSNRDLGEKHPYPGIASDTWIPCGKAFVRYTSTSRLGFREISKIVASTPHQAIYLNSFFDPIYTQMVLLCGRFSRRPGAAVVIAPRGEFSAGALRLRAWRKYIFIKLIGFLKIYNGLTWQASSAAEAEDINRSLSFGSRINGKIIISGHVAVAPDMAASRTDIKDANAISPRAVDASLSICTLSRISPMKNLDFSLRTLGLVKIPAVLHIYGPIEDASYWAKCQKLIAELPPNISVVQEGAVLPKDVVSTLSRHDLFLLPTRGENFGHVIHEALRAGLPLLISDQTPWKQLDKRGVGWEIPLSDMEAFAKHIEEVFHWKSSYQIEVAERSQAFANEVGASAETLEANRRLFLDLIEGEIQSG